MTLPGAWTRDEKDRARHAKAWVGSYCTVHRNHGASLPSSTEASGSVPPNAPGALGARPRSSPHGLLMKHRGAVRHPAGCDPALEEIALRTHPGRPPLGNVRIETTNAKEACEDHWCLYGAYHIVFSTIIPPPPHHTHVRAYTRAQRSAATGGLEVRVCRKKGTVKGEVETQEQ